MKIENWSVICLNMLEGVNVYLPPEAYKLQLQGNVYGHPNFPDGDYLHTSNIVKVEGRTVTTHSGNVYELGKIDSSYYDWCVANNRHVPTDEEPIKVHK